MELTTVKDASVGNPNTYKEAYHVTNSELHNWDDLYLEFGRILGIEPHIVHIPTEFLMVAKSELFSHINDEKKYPGVFDSSKFHRAVPEFHATTSLHQGLSSIIEWYEEEQHGVDPVKDMIEDHLVALHREWSRQLRTF